MDHIKSFLKSRLFCPDTADVFLKNLNFVSLSDLMMLRGVSKALKEVIDSSLEPFRVFSKEGDVAEITEELQRFHRRFTSTSTPKGSWIRVTILKVTEEVGALEDLEELETKLQLSFSSIKHLSISHSCSLIEGMIARVAGQCQTLEGEQTF